MTRFPDQLKDRLAHTIASTQRAVNTAHQRLNSIGSQVSALVPGDWQPVTLTASWINLPGYIPAQVRIQQAGLALLVGTIDGGLTPDGTIIGTLPDGYYSPAWSQAFPVTVMTGAAASSQPGVLTDLAGDLGSGTVSCSGALAGTAPATYNAGYEQSLANRINYSLVVATGLSLHSGATTTPVNMNTPMMTVDTSGNLTLANCPATATQLSFCEHLPLA